MPTPVPDAEDDQIEFRSDVTVEPIRVAARDSDVVWAARVSTAGQASRESVDTDAAGDAGLIRWLLTHRHGSPFEHNSFTFLVSAPIFVFREFMRHRIGFSYNEESGRYRELKPQFYVPDDSRNLVQTGKPGAYHFVPGTATQTELTRAVTMQACTSSYRAYKQMLNAGIAREVARGVLPVCTYSTMYVTCNARSLMAFLSLRTTHPDSTFPSYPQREIEMVAQAMETIFAAHMPVTHDAFTTAGRVAP